MEGQEQEENKMDIITVDVPLFIRLLEFAREDATDDMMLHDVAEKLIEMCADGDIMQMEQYDEIVGSKEQVDTSGMNAVEDNMHPQNKDMNTINEQRWMKLAGIITENEFKQLNEIEQLYEMSGLSKYLTIAAIMAVTGLGAALKIKSHDKEIVSALENGDKVKITLDKELGLFTKHSDHNTDYFIKLNPSQQEPIKVDTSTNVVTIKDISIADDELARKVNNAVREIDPSLADNWEERVYIGGKPGRVSSYAPKYVLRNLTNVNVDK
jgi:hypothetical protein